MKSRTTQFAPKFCEPRGLGETIHRQPHLRPHTLFREVLNYAEVDAIHLRQMMNRQIQIIIREINEAVPVAGIPLLISAAQHLDQGTRILLAFNHHRRLCHPLHLWDNQHGRRINPARQVFREELGSQHRLTQIKSIHIVPPRKGRRRENFRGDIIEVRPSNHTRRTRKAKIKKILVEADGEKV